MGKPITTIDTYLHGSKEYSMDLFEEMEEDGVFDDFSKEEKSDFLENFIYTNYEVTITLDVYKNGDTKIVEVDGHKVLYEPKQLILFK